MNFVFISPQFPKHFENFIFRLRDKGVRVLGVGDTPYGMLEDSLKQGLTEYYWVQNMEDYDQVLRALGFFTHKYGKIDRIESHNEYWLDMDARLRKDFNVYGLKPEDMVRMQRKSGMKTFFRSVGIPVADGRVFSDYEDAVNLFNELGGHVAIKPDKGVGTSDTYRINSIDDLNNFFSIKADIDYIMEAFIEGSIETFDGLTNREGEIVFCSSLIYDRPTLDILEEDLPMYYYIPRELPADIVEAGSKIVRAFDIRERFFHIEFFRTPENEVVALEMNCRPPGGFTPDMFNYANNIDMYDQYANIVCYDRFTANVTRPYNSCYVSRRFNRNYVYTQEQILERYGAYMSAHGVMPTVFSTLMGDTYYIFRTEDLEKMHEIINYINAIH